MKILIVDDSITIRNILKVILEENHHEVVQLTNGQEAVDKFLIIQPELILMDVEMEGLSGYETVAKIRGIEKNNSNTTESWTPIIFLSALTDEKSLAVGIESGGDDYLFKPFSKVVLNAKIKAMDRLGKMQQAILEQKSLVDKINKDLLEEQMVAKHVYDNIVQNGVLQKHDFIKTFVSSKDVFNGDLALVATSPSENYYMIMGDFTGHGLSAALGIIPAAEVFLNLTIKGFTLEQLLIELNNKLNVILPSNIFCAAAVVEVSFERKELSVWNGWAPPVLCFTPNGELKTTFASSNLPLGSIKKQNFNYKLNFVDLAAGDKVYIFSDGFTETKNANGNMFGVEGVIASIGNSLKNNLSSIDHLVEDVLRFRGKLPQQDDLTLIEITMGTSNGDSCSKL